MTRESESKAQRDKLWSLLGTLPERGQPIGELLRTERRGNATVEWWRLELNGVEPVPAVVVVPDDRADQCAGLLYIHSHGGDFSTGKSELFTGAPYLQPYVDDLIGLGAVVVAIDAWSFEERRHDEDGARGDYATFASMLVRGQVLMGMSLFDEQQALSWLARRPEVDAQRLGVLGMSMGAVKAWWLAALDERVKLCVDICCLTDIDELLAAGNAARQAAFFWVPGLLRYFSSADINALIAPRMRLSMNGLHDDLTPVKGLDVIENRLRDEYARLGKPENFQLARFDVGHVETAEMRELALSWLRRL